MSARALLTPVEDFPDDFLIISLLSIYCCFFLAVHTPVPSHQVSNLSVPTGNDYISLVTSTSDLNKRDAHKVDQKKPIAPVIQYI